MTYAVSLAALALVLFALLQVFMRASPATLAVWLRRSGPIALLTIGGGLTLVGRGVLGGPLLALGLALLRATASPRLPPDPGSSRHSTVRSRHLEMTLDHDSGDLAGRVHGGRFDGRDLDDLTDGDLGELRAELAADPESLRLLEAYLDRRSPGWRDDAQPDVGGGLGGTPGAGSMTEEQAYQILGLQPGATLAEIREAHRRLMKRVHPDQGGTDFLAARINEAKAVLLNRHD